MNINSYSMFSYIPSMQKRVPEKMTLKDENFSNNVIPKVQEVMSDIVSAQVPENGLFRKVFVTFDVPQSGNEAMLYLEPDSDEPKTQRLLSIGVHNPNSDVMFSNFLLKGNKSEILNYLANEKNKQEIIDSVFELSPKVDDYHSSL